MDTFVRSTKGSGPRRVGSRQVDTFYVVSVITGPWPLGLKWVEFLKRTYKIQAGSKEDIITYFKPVRQRPFAQEL
jgi:hypothetical protein